MDRSRRTTATTQVEDTYYGLPVIKPPHWRWLIINYFFFGAVAGGSSVIAALGDLAGRDPMAARAGRYVTFAAGAPAPILLILDLGRPERALNMFRVLKLKSPMSLGSWALGGLGLFASLSAGFELAGHLLDWKVPYRRQRTIDLLGLPFALFVSGYTGVLLAATNVPLWARNYLLIGPTFVASAFSSSLAAISLALGPLGGKRETADRLARAETICLTAELGLLLAGLLRLGRLGRPLTTGRYGLLFWPIAVVGGIITPLALHLKGPARFRPFAAVLTLAGGYAFRALIVLAGRESARRPEDYFAYTTRKTDR